jgi:hypothetical protein
MWNQDRLVFLLAFIVILGATLWKPGFPLTVTPMVKTVYNAIESVEEDGVFVLALSSPFHYKYDATVGDIAVLKHMTQLVRSKGCKIVIIAMSVDQAIINREIINNYLIPPGFLDGLVYGEDYIDIGFMPGEEVAAGAIATDLRSYKDTDWEGIPLSEFPMMDDINDIDDYSVLYFSLTSSIDRYPRQWGEAAFERGIPILGMTLSASYTFAMPWIEQGYVTGLLNSGRGAAEYEQYASLIQNDNRFMGTASTLMDVYSIIHLFAVGLILVGFADSAINLAKGPTEVETN